MIEVKTVLKIEKFKTYELRTEIVEYAGTETPWEAAYSLIDGSYIGDRKSAEDLEQMGIAPQLKRSSVNTASIGFCEEKQKWYGWSHRAIYGFGMGSKVKKGSCAYSPTDPQDLLEYMIRFWVEDENESVTKTIVLNQELRVKDPLHNQKGLGALLETECIRKKDEEILRSRHWNSYPDIWGKGEWQAKTLEDAKQMAIDFSDGVS